MPKNEFDPEDPMELVGVSLATSEDTLTPMAECFIEEFMMMRFNAKQILALFQNPGYTGPHMVFRERGEEFVRKLIDGKFAQWQRPTEQRATSNE